MIVRSLLCFDRAKQLLLLLPIIIIISGIALLLFAISEERIVFAQVLVENNNDRIIQTKYKSSEIISTSNSTIPTFNLNFQQFGINKKSNSLPLITTLAHSSNVIKSPLDRADSQLTVDEKQYFKSTQQRQREQTLNLTRDDQESRLTSRIRGGQSREEEMKFKLTAERREEVGEETTIASKMLLAAAAVTTTKSQDTIIITNLQNQQIQQNLTLQPISSNSSEGRNLSKLEEMTAAAATNKQQQQDSRRPTQIQVPSSKSLLSKGDDSITSSREMLLQKVAKKRHSRSPGQQQQVRQVANHRTPSGPVVASVHAIVGQRLSVPCTGNLSSGTVLAAASASGSGSSELSMPFNLIPIGNNMNLSNATQQRHRLQQQQQSQRWRLQQQQQQQQTRARTQTQVANGQGISLIVWHKDDQLDSPIFSVDARIAQSLREAKQVIALDSPVKGRARFEESTRVDSRNGLGSTPALVIDEATSQDAGLYTCTVEFHKAATQTHQVRVALINPPKNMAIIQQDLTVAAADSPPGNQQRIELTGDLTIGPYDEDSKISLTCEVEPGEPVGQVSWWQLKSISSIPSNFNLRQLPALKSVALVGHTNNTGGSSINVAEFLTTTTLDQQQADLSSSSSSSYSIGSREIFVSFHETAQEYTNFLTGMHQTVAAASSQVETVGPRLKHWIRVAASSSNNNNNNNADSNGSSDSLALSSAPFSERKLQSNLQLSLTRETLGQEYLCLARNNDLISPLNSSIKINLNLKPTQVKIVNKQNLTFRLGQKVTIECHVYGSKPAPKLSWFINSQELEPGRVDEDDNDDSTSSTSTSNNNIQHYISEINRDINNNNLTKVSYLTLVPQLHHNQQTLSCVGQNLKITNSPSISDFLQMNVQFAAKLNLQFGSSIKPESVKLGNDVFMDCNIQSNPPIDDLIWLFNDQPLIANASAGIIMSNQSLVLQRVRVEHRGQYQCVTHNLVGKSQSNKLFLRPKFEPVCDYSLTKNKYEIPVNQATRIECNVLAEPGEDLHFVWKFNQTFSGSATAGDHAIVDPSSSSSSPSSSENINQFVNQEHHYHLEDIKQYETNFTKSIVVFAPKSKRQYGQLLCSASNSMGKQEHPCVINIIPSEIPEPVFGCFFDNPTNQSFSVHCQSPAASSTSGRQNYLLELYTNERPTTLNDQLDQDQKTGGGAAAANSAHAERSDHLSSTHLRQKQQNSSPDSVSGGDTQDDQGQDDRDDDEEQTTIIASQSGSRQQHQLQHQVKRVSSDTPSFHMTDLKPDTSYNLMIYVQNSKGRSAPAFYQTNTLPGIAGSNLDSSITSDSGEPNGVGSINKVVQLVNNNSRRITSSWAQTISATGEQQQSLSNRLISYLRIGDYLTAEQANSFRPILGIALVILLCTLSVVAVTFFVSRTCRPPGDQQQQHRRRRSNQSTSDNSTTTSQSERTKLDQNGGLKRPTSNALEVALDRGLQLTKTTTNVSHSPGQPAPLSGSPMTSSSGLGSSSAAARLKVLAGSGSDTSRDTNTESTLVSSYARTGGCLRGGIEQQRTINRFNNNKVAQQQQQTYLAQASSQTPSPLLLSARGLIASALDQQPSICGSNSGGGGVYHHNHHHHQSQAGAKLRSNLSSPLELEQLNSSTPPQQLSIHSASDCTTSGGGNNNVPVEFSDNNNNNRLLAVAMQQCQQQENNQNFLVPDDPIYVIRGPQQQQQFCISSSQPATVNNLNWPYNGEQHNNCGGSLSGGTQVSSDSYEQSTISNGCYKMHNHNQQVEAGCQLVGDNDGEQQQQQHLNLGATPIGFLQNSVSIPVSLSDCLQQQQQQQQHNANYHHQRRLSQDFLPSHSSDICFLNSNVGSYLTLATPSENLIGHIHQSPYQQQQNFTLQTNSNPYNNCASVVGDQQFCTQTLDDSYRRQEASRSSRLPAGQGNLLATMTLTNQRHYHRGAPMANQKRCSFDGAASSPAVVQHQRPHVKFDTSHLIHHQQQQQQDDGDNNRKSTSDDNNSTPPEEITPKRS